MLRLVVVLSLLFPLIGVANAADTEVQALKEKLSKRVPQVSTESLRKSTDLPGWYEVEHGMQLLYITADGKYALAGDLIDLEGMKNVTGAWRQQTAIKKINAINEKDMIVIGPANAKRTITVFTDVDCPYCARLHEDVPTLNKNGVKVRYLLFPRGGPGSDTFKKSVAVWCAPDRAKAVGIAKAGGKLDMKTCPNPVEAHFKLGVDLNVSGTPAVYADDGKILGGYVPGERLLAMLNIKPSTKTSDAR